MEIHTQSIFWVIEQQRAEHIINHQRPVCDGRWHGW